eukprot:TRINITY_DN5122_c0_g1_i7.p1 TRINITY_DN5122_c0_g1~~TRINITY_DN5122_c0_g1_i7.p1  ORF type:complete len:120 (-),score=9.10 TRINITY_DN5122_c0_g1_i7:240-599(-)
MSRYLAFWGKCSIPTQGQARLTIMPKLRWSFSWQTSDVLQSGEVELAHSHLHDQRQYAFCPNTSTRTPIIAIRMDFMSESCAASPFFSSRTLCNRFAGRSKGKEEEKALHYDLLNHVAK